MTPNFRRLLGAYSVSTAGDWLFHLALPLLVYQLTHSAFGMAAAYGLAYLPLVLFSPIGGVIADRVDRHKLLVTGDLVSSIGTGLLALAIWQNFGNSAVIFPAAFLLAGIAPFYHPAFQGLIPSAVSREQLSRANGWLHGMENVLSVMGPVAGAALIAALGMTGALVIDSVSFLGSALLISRMHITPAGYKECFSKQSSWKVDLKEGLQFIFDHPTIRCGALLFLGTNFAITLIQANYVYFQIEVLSCSSAELGIALAIPGAGAIVGAIIAPRLGNRFESGSLILGCTFVGGLATLPLVFVENPLVAATIWAVATAMSTVNAVTWYTLRQRIVPPHLLGRVVALTRLVAFAAIPLSALVGGFLLNATGRIELVILLAVAVRLAAGLLGLRTPLFRVREDQHRRVPGYS